MQDGSSVQKNVNQMIGNGTGLLDSMDRIEGQWKIQINTEYESIYKLNTRGILDLGNWNVTTNGTELFRCDVKKFVTNGSPKVESISIELLFEEQKGEKPLSYYKATSFSLQFLECHISSVSRVSE